MHKLRIPESVDNNGDFYPERNLTVKLVDTLLGGEIPDPDLVFRYYGIPPRSAFKATEADRLVFWDEDIGYIIMPDAYINMGLWSKI
jgi:hypothetical protein